MRSKLIINLANLQHNYLHCAKLSNNVGAVVKADAYGLGAVKVSLALNQVGCRDFFIATIQEGKQIRQHLDMQNKIYILNSVSSSELMDVKAYNLTPVCSQIDDIKFCLQQNIPFLVQIDTGLCRLGLNEEELHEIELLLNSLNDVLLEGFLTQFIDSDIYDHKTISQITIINRIKERFSTKKVSIANTGGLDHGCAMDISRIGRGLYGSCNADSILKDKLKPVINLKAQILQIKHIKANQGISYQHKFISSRPMRVGVVSIGYADGLPYNLPFALGKVGMDLTMFEVDQAARVGDWFDIITDEYKLDDIANSCELNPRYILVCLGNASRLEKFYT